MTLPTDRQARVDRRGAERAAFPARTTAEGLRAAERTAAAAAEQPVGRREARAMRAQPAKSSKAALREATVAAEAVTAATGRAELELELEAKAARAANRA
jgi:hypothetical protein